MVLKDHQLSAFACALDAKQMGFCLITRFPPPQLGQFNTFPKPDHRVLYRQYGLKLRESLYGLSREDVPHVSVEKKSSFDLLLEPGSCLN